MLMATMAKVARRKNTATAAAIPRTCRCRLTTATSASPVPGAHRAQPGTESVARPCRVVTLAAEWAVAIVAAAVEGPASPWGAGPFVLSQVCSAGQDEAVGDAVQVGQRDFAC